MIARTVLVCTFSTQKHSPSMNNESEAFITLIKNGKKFGNDIQISCAEGVIFYLVLPTNKVKVIGYFCNEL